MSPDTHSSPTTTDPVPMRGASRGPLGGGFGLFVALVLFGSAGWMFYNYRAEITTTNAAPEQPVATPRPFLCSVDGNQFFYGMKEHESPPVNCPKCKKTTAYPCEACYYTKDGGIKDSPTWVILNHYLGKKGDTICPDCGHVVIGHNPDPRKREPVLETPADSEPPTSQPTSKDADGEASKHTVG